MSKKDESKKEIFTPENTEEEATPQKRIKRTRVSKAAAQTGHNQLPDDMDHADKNADSDSHEDRIPLEEMSSRQIGEKGEEIAAKYLIKRGYKIIQTNWTCQIGEADIVAQDGDNVVLVEVKTRRILNQDDSIMPELAVNRAKQEKYRTLALMYAALHPALSSIRFDVVAINLVAPSTASLRHLIGAFSWDEQ